MEIFIRVEISARELDGKILLALVAAGRGHRVLICDWPTMARRIFIRKQRRGYVHMNSLTPAKSTRHFHRIFKASGLEISSSDEEAGITWPDYGVFARLRYSAETLASASAVFCWGEYDYRGLCEAYPSYSEKFHKTGSPRVDLWGPQFSELYSQPIDGVARPYVLVTSSLGGPLVTTHLHERLMQRRQKGDISQALSERDDGVLTQYLEGVTMTIQYIRLLRLMSIRLPELDIVVKPHPKESLDAWNVLIASAPRVRIVSNISFSTLARQSAAVITSASTTAIEARFLGIPIISFNPVDTPSRDTSLINSLGYKAKSGQDVVSTLEDILEESGSDTKSLPEKEIPNSLRHRILFESDKLAAERIVEVWEANDPGAGLDSRDFGKRNLKWEDYLYWAASAFPTLAHATSRRMKRRNGRKRKVDTKFPPLEKQEVLAKIRQMQLLLGQKGIADIRFVGKRSILFDGSGNSFE